MFQLNHSRMSTEKRSNKEKDCLITSPNQALITSLKRKLSVKITVELVVVAPTIKEVPEKSKNSSQVMSLDPNIIKMVSLLT